MNFFAFLVLGTLLYLNVNAEVLNKAPLENGGGDVVTESAKLVFN